MMMYPFALRDGGGGVGGETAGGLFRGVVRWGVGQIHLHVVRHFFQEVRGDQTAVAVHFALRRAMEKGDVFATFISTTACSLISFFFFFFFTSLL